MIKWSAVKDELDKWRCLIGDDVVDAIISNLQEETENGRAERSE